MGQEHFTGTRGKGALADALEQRQAEPALQLGDLHADGGLGQIELARGPRKRAVPGDGLQRAERAEGEVHGGHRS